MTDASFPPARAGVIAGARYTDAVVLVVDDEEANVDLLEQMLAGAGYASVIGTIDARRALPLFRQHQPDLVLLDLLMPHLDGFAVLEQIRAELNADDYLPVLVLTADATRQTKERALAAGARDFLTKPFERVELLLRIGNLLETRRLHQQLLGQMAAIQRLYDEARQALTLRDQTIAVISHDLGQPLSAIRVASRVLSAGSGQVGADVAESMLDAIDDAVTSMSGMLGELLDLGRIQAGKPLDLEYRQTDLVALVGQEVDVWRHVAAGHTFDYAPALPILEIDLDPPRLRRVLSNLLSNAVKYSPPGRRVTVTVDGEDDRTARIRVRDEGAGIPAADLVRISEAFHRAANVRGHTPGAGLGLFGSRRVVEAHGGTLTIESTEGEGTTVTVRLPLE